jgi:hypothetical protein
MHLAVVMVVQGGIAQLMNLVVLNAGANSIGLCLTFQMVFLQKLV